MTRAGDDVTTERDWTCKEGRSNSSELFETICEHVEQLIRNDAHALIGGRADITARLIVAQLAHVHHLTPPTRGAGATSDRPDPTGQPGTTEPTAVSREEVS